MTASQKLPANAAANLVLVLAVVEKATVGYKIMNTNTYLRFAIKAAVSTFLF